MTGNCCRMAIPSSPPIELIRKASKADQFARDFLSIFIPYDSPEIIKQKSPEFYENALNLAKKSPKYAGISQLTFYHCRFIGNDNKCMIHEDRPRLCRDYPDTPYLLMHPNCAFKEWSLECKSKYKDINTFLDLLKEILKTIKNDDFNNNNFYRKDFLTSPGYTFLKK